MFCISSQLTILCRTECSEIALR